MSITTKDYFIVLDRNYPDKKDPSFRINFFYLKSFKENRRGFTYIKEPFFRGVVTFGSDFKNKLRPIYFSKVQKNDVFEPIDPRLFKKFVLAENNKFVAFSKNTNQTEFHPIKQMLSSLQFDKIIELTFCSKCLERNVFNILGSKTQIKTFKNQIVCPDCALDTLISEAKRNGFITDEKMNPKLKNFFKHMILKFKNTDKVFQSFKVEFDPSKHKDLTLYDVEKNPAISKKYMNLKVDDLKIQEKLKSIYKLKKINSLLPIQAISIERGLIDEHTDQLVMAPTSAGKTLVGELAGLNRILAEDLKMLYLVPIVALANVRTEEFEVKYRELNLNIVKKVGESILERHDGENLEELEEANIIIATYEAIDYILRSGNKERLGKLGTIVIDEIQSLTDPERGYILDGLISRLKLLFKNAQFLYLSATIGSPQILADKLNCLLINYNNRPVPIERHLLICPNEALKHKYLLKLVRSSFSETSEFGFRGQSIIFTNSRKKCDAIANYLVQKNVSAKSYHSGLTNEERKEIEAEFQNQKIQAVVATAALAAGVDFPAKQVIFESLSMGIKILTVAEFEQMLGRAGRLKKHEVGLAYLLVEPGKYYKSKMNLTEENIAISLLNGKIKDFQLDPDENRSLTELLSLISISNEGLSSSMIYEFHKTLINADYDVDQFLKKLTNLKLIETPSTFKYRITDLGRAIAKSFLTIEESFDIIARLKQKTASVLEVVLNLKPLKNVYLSKKVVADLSKNINMKYFSNNFFSASILSLMNAEYIKKRKKFSQEFIELVLKWTSDIFNCKCSDNPYCPCGRLNLEKIIFKLRTVDHLSIEDISNYLRDFYEILVFKGDIIDYLENLIYSFESIQNISKGIVGLHPTYQNELSEIPQVIANLKE